METLILPEIPYGTHSNGPACGFLIMYTHMRDPVANEAAQEIFA
jgi:hypothetical protein